MVENGFDGDQLALAIKRLPRGKARIEAYQEAVRLADAAQDAYWQMGFRFEYAAELYFQDDPPKCIPVAAEFGPIFEGAPAETRTNDAMVQAYLMVTQMGVEVMKDLPQIPMTQYDTVLEQYNQLTKRYGIGRRTYFWQMHERWEYVDPERALEYIELAMQTPPDEDCGNCKACEYSWAAKQYIRLGRLDEAQRYVQPLETYPSPRAKARHRLSGLPIWRPLWIGAIWKLPFHLHRDSIKREIATGRICALSARCYAVGA